MKKSEIEDNYERIIKFADIGEFLDAPVSTYSSGMRVRLGFAIAIHSQPDIVLVDEILAVGDAKFQRKCLDRINEMRDDGVTFILVSHNLQNIEGMCDQALLLHKGKQLMLGKTGEVVSAYELLLQTEDEEKSVLKEKAEKVEMPIDHNEDNKLKLVRKYAGFGTDEIKLESIRLLDSNGDESLDYDSDDSLEVEVIFGSDVSIAKAKLWLSFIYMNDYEKDYENTVALGVREEIDISKGKTKLNIKFSRIGLTTGEYKLAFHIFDNSFTNPYQQGHYGYFRVRNDVPTMMKVGTSTPANWARPEIDIINIK